jgi:hypothetical protein
MLLYKEPKLNIDMSDQGRTLEFNSRKMKTLPDMVAYGYNPSYSRGRHQKDSSLKPVWAKS